MEEKSAKLVRLDNVNTMSQRLLCSKRQIYRLNSAGLIPRSQKLSGSVCWISNEVDAWIRSGFPDRKAWEEMTNSKKGWKT